MLPTDLFNSIKQLAHTPKPLIIPAAAPTAVSESFQVGQHVQGQVQAQVSQGIFKVKVADQTLQMTLPGKIQTSDTIELQVVSVQPRLTFSLAASSNPISTPDALSTTAKLLSALAEPQPDKAKISATQSSPLWQESKAPEAPHLAAKLQEALTQSGLFYESHQAQWIGGQRTTADLFQEPQNALVPANQYQNAQHLTADTTAHATAQPAAQPALTPLTSDSPSIQDKPLATANLSLTSGTDSATTQPGSLKETVSAQIPEHLRPIVQQQLNALETRHLMWQGQVWPDQNMDWEIREEHSGSGGSNLAENRQWATEIRLDLPKLGEVTALLRYNSAGLSLVLDAHNTETRTRMGNASSSLVAMLKERGITVTSSLVSKHE
ncbi:MAG: flagellar hook-length control protein FliK [Pseudomonadota bacterium]